MKHNLVPNSTIHPTWLNKTVSSGLLLPPLFQCFRNKGFLILMAWLFQLSFSKAQTTLVTYAPTGTAATTVATGLTASAWSKNSLTTTNASCTSNNFSATGVDDASSSAAVSSQNYFSFSITPSASTCNFTINEIDVKGIYSNSGNVIGYGLTLQWYYQIGSGSWTALNTGSIAYSNSCSSLSNYTLTGLNITSTAVVNFRLVVYGAWSSSNVMSINTNVTALGSVVTPPVTTGASVCIGGSGNLTSSTTCPALSAVSTAATNAGSATTGGTGVAWSNPSNLTSNNNLYTTIALTSSNKTSQTLTTSNYGFAIPANSTINGITVTIGRYKSAGGNGGTDYITDNSLKLVKAGTAVGTDLAATGTNWPTTETAASYGSTSNLWSSAWTAADINNSNFGVALIVNTGNAATGSIDYITITVNYTDNGTLNWYTASTGGTLIGFGTSFNPVGVTNSGLANTNTAGTTTFYAECTANSGCRAATSFTINPNNTVTSASSTPKLCVNTALTNITHTTTRATGIGTATGLPAGVSASWASNTITISGTPTASGTFNYSIPLTGGCGSVNATGTITVGQTASGNFAYSAYGFCNSVITAQNIASSNFTGATGTFSSTAGLSLNSTTGAITPSASSANAYTVTYTVPASSGCSSYTTTTAVTIDAAGTGTISYSPSSFCITATGSTSPTITGAGGTGAATWIGASPSGLNMDGSGAITPIGSTAGTYTVTYYRSSTGLCPTYSTTATVTITPANTVSTASSAPSLCINTALTAITHTTSGATGIGTATGLPTGVTASWASNTITIGGTPTAAGTFNYSIPLTGGCGSVNATGTITVNSIPTISGTTPNSNCGTGTVALGATASAGTINWYAASTGGSSLATGASYTTPSISSTTNYYVDATANGCTTAARTAIAATINAIPTISGTTPNSRCGTGTVALGATASAGTISWYAASTGGSSLTTGTSYTTPSISSTTNYYVDATASGCTTAARTAVTATVSSATTTTSIAMGSLSSSVLVNTALTSFTISALNSCSQTTSGYTSPITVSKVSGTGSISGTTSINAVSGVATFSNIKFSQVGVYTIKGSDGTLNTTTSANIIVSDATSLTSINPTSGYVGATVTITGTGFMDGAGNNIVSSITLSGATISSSNYTVNSATSITVTIPNGSSTGVFVVTTSNGNGTSAIFTCNGSISVQSGDWSNSATWYGGIIPSSTNDVTINTNHIVTYTSASSTTLSAKSITVNGTLKNNYATAFSITSGMTVNNSATYEHNLDGSVIPTATWNTGSTCLIDGVVSTVPTVSSFNQNFYNLTWNSTAQTANTSLAGNLQNIAHHLTVTSTGSTGSLSLNSNSNSTLNIAGNLILTGGTLNLSDGSGVATIKLMGDYNQSGGNITSSGSKDDTIKFINPTVAENITMSSGTMSTAYPVMWVIGSSSVSTYLNFGSNINFGIGNIYAFNNSTINFQTYSVTTTGYFNAYNSVNLITANASVFGGSFSGISSSHISIPSTSDLILNGSVAQTIGTLNTSNTCNSITINNSNGVTNNITINTHSFKMNGGPLTNNAKIVCDTMSLNGGSITSSDTIRTGILLLNNGLINMSSKELYVISTLNNAITGYSPLHSSTSSSYIIGSLRRKVATGDYDFPVGTSSKYHIARIHINSNSNVDNILVNFNTWGGSNLSYATNTPNIGVLPVGAQHTTAINGMLDYGYYEVTPANSSLALITSPSINYDATMTFNGHTNGVLGAAPYCLIKAPHTNNTIVSWGLGGGTFINSTQQFTQGSSRATVTAKLSGLTSFSVFAIGFNNNSIVLPLQLTDFEVAQKDNNANLTWSVFDEKGLKNYTIERTTDLVSYSSIGEQIPAYNDALNNYNYTDFNIADLNAEVIYYRIKMNFMDGSFNYSPVKAIEVNASAEIEMHIYPNPVMENLTVNFNSIQSDKYQLLINDENGKLINLMNIEAMQGQNNIDASALTNALPMGVYIITLQNASATKRKRIKAVKGK